MGERLEEDEERPTLDAGDAETLDGAPAGRVSTERLAAGERPVKRYVPIDTIGRGGMGVVTLAEDTLLGRRVALKARLDGKTDERGQLRFLEEARATAQLEHPSIVPVYDLDPAPEDGRAFFSMRYVEGRSLGDVLDGLRAGDEETTRRFGPAELLLVFLKVCDAVAYAHDRGVLHRDLKPDNVMLGRFGEVFVMDWGLARVAGSVVAEGPASGERLISSVRESVGESANVVLTHAGAILGTPGYMAPEQVRGEPDIDARADVYSLGAILYELLTLQKATEGRNLAAMLAAAMIGAVIPPRERAPERNVSEGLEAIVLRALTKERADRWPSVLELRDAVAAELEGSREAARRRAAAEEKLAAADAHIARHRAVWRDHESLALEVVERRASLPKGFDDATVLRPIWQSEQRAADLAADSRRAFWDAYGALVGAVHADPAMEHARDVLVKTLLGRARELRLGGERDAAEDLIALARQHDAPRVQALLDVAAEVRLTTEPAGARVRLLRIEEEGPLLVERDRGLAPERTPCTLRLEPGEWIVVVDVEHHDSVRVSMVVEAGERVDRAVRLPRRGTLAAGMVYIPGGRYIVRGDHLARPAPPPRHVETTDFAIARCSVTMGEYARFLTSLPADEAQRRAPRLGSTIYWRADPDRVYRVPFTDADGDRFEADHPVIAVSADDAEAFARWMSEHDGRTFALPTSDEWEIAARGASDRVFSWGNRFDPSLCWSLQSFAGPPMPRPVGSRPTDQSPFGVCDVAGLARNWTSTAHGAEERLTRGGAWQALPEQCRIGRHAPFRAGTTYVTIGFRLVQRF